MAKSENGTLVVVDDNVVQNGPEDRDDCAGVLLLRASEAVGEAVAKSDFCTLAVDVVVPNGPEDRDDCTGVPA